MAKICAKCGKKIGAFSNDPFEWNDVVLCYDCAKPICNDINSLYYQKSNKDFYDLKNKIMKTSASLYSIEIVNSIHNKINFIYSQNKASVEDDIPQIGSKPNGILQDNSRFVNDIPQAISTQSTTNNYLPKEQHNYSQNTSKSDFSLDDLYSNIGNKLKGLAKWIFIVEAICAFITGFALIATDEDFILAGLLTLFCGPIVAWVSSWILYAFGELVEKTSANEQNTKDILKIMQKYNK